MEAEHLEVGKKVFINEANALVNVSSKLDNSFVVAVDVMLRSKGRVVVCGMGKSGIIGKKIAATLSSTGTPSFFMHPAEAYHGDLGMVAKDDIFLAISNSGETEEVIKLIPFIKDNRNVLISLTGNPNSTLAKASYSHLDIGVDAEACPLQLAPTSSTTATLAMGDAIAVTLMKARNFKPEHFARFHPGGSLGRRLLSRVEHEMVCDDLPLVSVDAEILDVIKVISQSGLGIAIVPHGLSWGIITDGDVRRAIEKYGQEVFAKRAHDFMTTDPAQVSPATRVEDALFAMEKKSISALLVIENNRLLGVFKK
ncbi:KpsF/GutQ family sugar-phosphate isomerase [Modicisalibacter luteus]|uniref:Arabinose 5-phosphate isomerase n=1 Tax=Modicisalibacter luteus TaxID=453962 RepID=A0ABV7LYE2_9GAMM|nr:KpsF/GutQ family sugar-phosphate isomerase [Halomonas lutea]GHB05397.1 capsule expression protein [Halomonas lutea]